MMTEDGRVGSADQALAVPATPLRVDGPSGFDPSRIELVRYYATLTPAELKERIADYDAEGIIIGRFVVRRFQDGDDIGLPKWAKHILIGGFAEQGWAAYDQNQRGKKVAGGKWGDALFRLRGGRITSKQHRYYSGILQDALAIAMEAAAAGETGTGSTEGDSAGRNGIAQGPSA